MARRAVATTILALALATAAPARADHIRAVPRFVFDDARPGVRLLELVGLVDRWEIVIGDTPANPSPGEQTMLSVRVRDRLDGTPYRGPVELTVRRVGFFGARRLVYGPMAAAPDGNVSTFHPTYPEDGNYDVTLALHDDSAISALTFPMVIGEPGSPRAVLAVFGAGLLVLVLAIQPIRQRRARRTRGRAAR